MFKLYALRISDKPGDVVAGLRMDANRKPIPNNGKQVCFVKFAKNGKIFCITYSPDPSDMICWIGEIVYDGKTKWQEGSCGGYNRVRLALFWKDNWKEAIDKFVASE